MRKITITIIFFVFCTSLISGQGIRCKVILQGAHNSGSTMNTDINLLLPTVQPYSILPWDYQGAESINSIPTSMVDWVLVELRHQSNPIFSVARRAALLLSDGNVVDTNLSQTIVFPSITAGNYYVCIYHHNHLPVMSANPVSIPNPVAYDFSDTLNFPPYGGGTRALIELEPGISGMITGDVNRDALLKYSGPSNDRAAILQYIVNNTGLTSITATFNGYAAEDANMDGVIKYSGPNNDPSTIIQNIIGITGSTSITTLYNSVVPELFVCGHLFVDPRDGNAYNTVQIGSQCWMAENLAYLPSVSPRTESSLDLPYYYVYDYNGTDVTAAKATANYQTYGVLYNWPAAMDSASTSNSISSGVQGVCPAGWHMPSDEEWKMLEGEVDSLYGYPDPEWDNTGDRGSDAGGNLKETGTVHWNNPNFGATNSSWFTALPAGVKGSNSFSSLGYFAYFWTSTEYSSTRAWYHRLNYEDSQVYRYRFPRSYGLSVRCIRDD